MSDLIVREQEPLNLEMPFSSLDGFITPNESFYVRCHFPVPEISADDWRLKIEGEVEAPFELSYKELRAMEPRTIAATLECAGNNRLYLEPKAKGVQWGLGAVGNASWTGVPLAALLERARPRAGAIEVILDGGRKDFLLPESAVRQGAGRCVTRLRDERRKAFRDPRVSAACDCARLVRD